MTPIFERLMALMIRTPIMAGWTLQSSRDLSGRALIQFTVYLIGDGSLKPGDVLRMYTIGSYIGDSSSLSVDFTKEISDALSRLESDPVALAAECIVKPRTKKS